jgi:hypothetical protein
MNSIDDILAAMEVQELMAETGISKEEIATDIFTLQLDRVKVVEVSCDFPEEENERNKNLIDVRFINY